MEEQQTRIVILGGGFGGVAAARTMAKKLKREKGVRITLIDKKTVHVFNPLLYEVATAFVEHDETGSAKLFRSGVAVELRPMLARWDVDFIHAAITGIDWTARTVALDGHEDVGFDRIVIALGSETNFYGIEGLEKNAATLKSVEEADALRKHVHEHLHLTEHGEEERFDTIIGGAGATGVELAGELMLFLRKHMAKGHIEAKDVNIALIQAAPKVLPAMPDPFPAWALERLQRLGIKVFLDTAISSVSQHEVTICPRPLREGETAANLVCDLGGAPEMTLKGDIIVWTGGIKGGSVLGALDVPLEGRGGRIKVTADFRVPERAHAWAIGDCIELDDPKTGRPVPWLAQAAIAEGKSVARQIVASVMGGEARPFEFREFPTIVTVGGKWAVVNLAGRRLRGRFVWFLRGAADFRYFLSILPFWRAVEVWWSGVSVYSQND